MAYFDLDVNPILERCEQRGDVQHVRHRIRCVGRRGAAWAGALLHRLVRRPGVQTGGEGVQRCGLQQSPPCGCQPGVTAEQAPCLPPRVAQSSGRKACHEAAPAAEISTPSRCAWSCQGLWRR